MSHLLVPRSLRNWRGLHDVKALIIYGDNHLLVVYKPSTVLTQGDSSSAQSLLGSLKQHVAEELNKPGKAYIGLVHRLDRPASGLLVFARTSKSAGRLGVLFRERQDVLKEYICMVNGRLLEERGDLTHTIIESPGSPTLVSMYKEVDEKSYVRQGKRILSAKLSYETLHVIERPESGQQQTLVKVKLETGRKHQIRAQMAHIGHPIVGDVKYGAPQRFQLKDIALHAFRLGFVHPTTKAPLTFSAGVPSSWASRFGQDVVDIVDRLCEIKDDS
jgi:23S rRNA pseudouridine1911/1915/1917 synthase